MGKRFTHTMEILEEEGEQEKAGSIETDLSDADEETVVDPFNVAKRLKSWMEGKEGSIDVDLLDADDKTAADLFNVAKRLKRWMERKMLESFISFHLFCGKNKGSFLER